MTQSWHFGSLERKMTLSLKASKLTSQSQLKVASSFDQNSRTEKQLMHRGKETTEELKKNLFCFKEISQRHKLSLKRKPPSH